MSVPVKLNGGLLKVVSTLPSTLNLRTCTSATLPIWAVLMIRDCPVGRNALKRPWVLAVIGAGATVEAGGAAGRNCARARGKEVGPAGADAGARVLAGVGRAR